MADKIDLESYFKNPVSKKQKQYEAIRAFIIDRRSAQEVASMFNYKISTVYTFIKNAKSATMNFFPEQKPGPKHRHTSFEVQKQIFILRNQNLSHIDIRDRLNQDGIEISEQTVDRILDEAGFPKLKRRTNLELGITTKNKTIPEKSENIDFEKLKPFHIDTPVAGVFQFIPYIIESGIVDIVSQINLPSSSVIGSVQASLSMLILKLMGNERLSHIENYDQEMGLGVFAGLNVLPKSTYMSTYSCLTSTEVLMDFQKQMENVWCGAKNKTMKGADTVIAQDAQSNLILYTKADILRREESQEVLNFVNYWKQINGPVNQTLVFDCKFTKYEVLDQLTDENIKFITLRKRDKKLIDQIQKVPEDKWVKVNLPIPKRKYQKVSVYEESVQLSKCKNQFRQIAVKDQGREKPTLIITNDTKTTLAIALEVYAKRWHVENKLAELVSFFNMNALSSPWMIRIHFDILWTMIADTLYHILAHDLRRFEKSLAPTIFKKFINIPGTVIFDGNKFQVKMRKRSHTPILMDVEKLQNPVVVPWLNNMEMEIIWTS